MSQKAYKFWRIKRWTEVWTQMPKEERDRIFGEMKKNLEDVGGKWILRCTCSWANEEYRSWGVNEYPSLEAAAKDGENLRKMDWARYVESESMLGLPYEEG
ncbi:MAG: hypothetical protein PVH59_09610 [Anaerolineae bacterium]|jgi:hypothetical protein